MNVLHWIELEFGSPSLDDWLSSYIWLDGAFELQQAGGKENRTWAGSAHGKDAITAGLTLTGVQESIKETHMLHSLMQQGKFS